MAQTFLNLAQGVTGTLPNANFSGGKVLQVVRSTLGSTTYTTSSSYTTFFDGAITPSNSNNYIYALLTYGLDLYGGGSTTEPQGNIRIVEGSSNTKSEIPLRTTNPGSSNYEREGGAISGYWQAGGTSALDINVNVNCTGGRVGLWGDSAHTNATALTLFEIEA